MVITFANIMKPELTNLIHGGLGSPLINKRNTHILPDYIDTNVGGEERNAHIKLSLKQLVRPGSLVMAQPFLDDDIRHLYQIPPKLTNWLNDKQNMGSYIPKELLPARYAEYKDGKSFFDSKRKFSLPCVIKVSSSSAGDGVHICKDAKTFQNTKKLLKNTKGTIFVEHYIEATANYGIQFGIPHDQSLPVDIIGINQQLTTPGGEFVGGVIDPARRYHELALIKEVILDQVLPHVREMGWYGVGCFDVLPDKSGNLYIIDANFRMTGMTAYLMLTANQQINQPLVSFSGEFTGTLKNFEDMLDQMSSDYDRKRKVHILALAVNDGVCRFNAAILYDTYAEINLIAKQLVDAGVVSKALNFFC
ncbi:MAG: hypothetical protein V4702_02845 [Patescibacteria group bacterium]